MSNPTLLESVPATGSADTMAQKLLIKRPVTVKSLVTDSFRAKANDELKQTQQQVQNQIDSVENQFQQALRQLEDAARQGQNVARPMDQLHRDVQQERLRLESLKQELAQQIEGLDKVRNGEYVKTGELETWAEVHIGDDLYKRMRNAEILIKDGTITAILEG